jgi:hypothetical protein
VFDIRSRLEEAATDAHMKRRGLDCFDATFHLDAGDCYSHGIADIY